MLLNAIEIFEKYIYFSMFIVILHLDKFSSVDYLGQNGTKLEGITDSVGITWPLFVSQGVLDLYSDRENMQTKTD